jgi:uncharacterized membrane protein YgaE (UPF0421/DUF939 family)
MDIRTKQSLKTALAMVIVYGFALWMDWDRPYWAGFAVAFTSLSTVGLSLNKGIRRLIGTLLAFVVSLLILAFFIQDRWWFILALSSWLGFCSYQYTKTKSYFWFVAGFVAAIISFDGGGDPVNSFNTAVLRVEETALGILVYTLVNMFIWPTSTLNELNNASTDLIAIQHKLFSNNMSILTRQGKSDGDLRIQEIQRQNHFKQALIAAETDTYEVRELKSQWLLFKQQSQDMAIAIDCLYSSLKEVSQLNIASIYPNLTLLTNELNKRFIQIEQIMAGNSPKYKPHDIELTYNKETVDQLSHFKKAAFTITHVQLQEIEALSKKLFNTASRLKGYADTPFMVHKNPSPWSLPIPDIECTIASIYTFTCMIFGFILWIYIDMPAGTSFVGDIAPFSIILAASPQIRALSLLPVLLLAIVGAGAVHILIMPHLTGFTQLGTLIFIVTFIVFYIFNAPSKAIIRSMTLAMFVSNINVSNEQVYQFIPIAESLIMVSMLMLFLMLMQNFPVSVKPEDAYLRLISRYFRSNAYLMGITLNKPSNHKKDIFKRWKIAFHSKEIETLPIKIQAWSGVINTGPNSDTSPAQLKALELHIYAITFRMQELFDTLSKTQDPILIKELNPDAIVWCNKIQKIFTELAHEPSSVSAKTMAEQLTITIDQLEVRMQEIVNSNIRQEISDLDRQNFYLLLGTYRGLVHETIRYATIAEDINWKRWKEPMFA